MSLHTTHLASNYDGTPNQLQGCLNDAYDLHDFYASMKPKSQTLVLGKQMTRDGVLGAVHDLLHKLGANDFGVITYSGHGTYLADHSGDEVDGRDEAIVCNDLEYIVDDEWAGILKARPTSSRLFVLTDSCFSGTVLRFFNPNEASDRRAKFIPSSHLPGARVTQRTKLRGGNRPLPGVVHFAACQEFEYSYDATFHGRPNGAFTYNVLQAANEAKKAKQTSFGGWWDATKKRLPTQSYPQTPVVNATAACMAWEAMKIN